MVLAVMVGAGQARAALPPNCIQSASSVSCTYSSTGTEQKFSVPVGVGSVEIQAVGAPGGQGFASPSGARGGAGAVATASLPVAGGETLYIEVGGAGGSYTARAAPGFNGGGQGGGRLSGGGGGESDVRFAPLSTGLNPDPRLIIAAGGGGGGMPSVEPAGFSGGNGGAAGSAGTAGAGPLDGTLTGGGGGQPGSTGGGAGGKAGVAGARCNVEGCTNGIAGGSGILGQGGAGAAGNPLAGGSGGGGGGGRYGGGGGGSGASVSGDISSSAAAGGGAGGGSSLVPSGGRVAANTSNLPPEVLITFRFPTGRGLTAPRPRPRLHLSIAGPHVVSTGQPASYRIILSRPKPDNQSARSVANVHVVSWHAGRVLRPWLIPTLQSGQSRVLRLRFAVPGTAHGRFCITATATARNARGAGTRHCVVVNRAEPMGGLG
jgi:hypothetical protein